jgi:hypothetical protein
VVIWSLRRGDEAASPHLQRSRARVREPFESAVRG